MDSNIYPNLQRKARSPERGRRKHAIARYSHMNAINACQETARSATTFAIRIAPIKSTYEECDEIGLQCGKTQETKNKTVPSCKKTKASKLGRGQYNVQR